MDILIILTGSLREPYKTLFNEYLKRLNRFAKVNCVELKEDKSLADKILRAGKGRKIILLDERGDEFSSKSLADFLSKAELSSESLAFVVGGANGHPEELKSSCRHAMSLSQLTFPHELSAVLLSEALYRAFTIKAGHPYHRE